MAVDLKALLAKIHLHQPNEAEDQTRHVCYEDYLQGPSQELTRRKLYGHVIGIGCLLL